MAAQEGRAGVVRLLLGAGADPNKVRDKYGTFPLFMAAQNGHSEPVRLLLEGGADPNKVVPGVDAFPLLIAAHNGHAEVVRLLLDAGADPNKVEKGGDFPLLLAAAGGHRQSVEYLLVHHAMIDQVDSQTGLTALAAALLGKRLRLAKDLIMAGANARLLPNEFVEWMRIASDEELEQLEKVDRALEEPSPADSSTLLDPTVAIPEPRTEIDSSSDSNDQERLEEPYSTNSLKSLDTTVAIPGPWTKMESDDNLNRELSVLVSLVAAADAFRGLWGNFGGNTLTRDGSLKLRHASFVMDFRDATLLCEILWLSMPGEEPIALHPGLDLSALLRDLKSRGARLNFREEEDRKRLAALALLVSDPPRFPLAEGQDLPLAPGAFRPRISSSEFWADAHSAHPTFLKPRVDRKLN